MSEITKDQKDFLLGMIGASGYEELEALARLLGNGDKSQLYSNPYYVAIRLLTQTLSRTKATLERNCGIGSEDTLDIDHAALSHLTTEANK